MMGLLGIFSARAGLVQKPALIKHFFMSGIRVFVRKIKYFSPQN